MVRRQVMEKSGMLVRLYHNRGVWGVKIGKLFSLWSKVFLHRRFVDLCSWWLA